MKTGDESAKKALVCFVKSLKMYGSLGPAEGCNGVCQALFAHDRFPETICRPLGTAYRQKSMESDNAGI